MTQHLVNALALGSLYALYALGIALIFGVMGLVNFAHGELILSSGITLYMTRDLPAPMRLGAALVVPVVLALVMERIAFRKLRQASSATLLVASFAVSIMLQNIARFWIGSRPKGVDVLPLFRDQIHVFGARVPMVSFVTVIAGTVLLAGLAVFLHRTPIGTQMRAAAEDFTMAQLCGVRANAVVATAFAISGLLAGAAAILLVGQTGTVGVGMGLSPVLFGFIAATLGGTGKLTGAVLGGLALGIVSVALQVNLSLDLRVFRDAYLFAIVLAVMVVRPAGLFARASAGRV